MNDPVSRLVEQRILMRAAIDCIAAPLAGDVRDTFLASAEARLTKALPAPSRENMRKYLRVVRD